ncbi:proline--tRNA ligase [Sulfurihydrogenibium subterraneum]|uniref:proline--tRNA ligase n=1 Tax=Sulfurihydrogenibium subterraneum TaxID=171121 RepID=UPI00048DE5B8|nr:proline--tRNA ligase [Sulfurihydrogenibium subterraneum]
MLASRYFMPTLKENPSEAQVPSHIYLIRGGFIRSLAAGIYEYLPLGFRVLKKIENVIRKRMDEAGALEVLLPILTPAELWKETGRWDVYGKELFRLKDRKDADFALGPTHEETITDLVRKNVRSYKDLPLNFYQIQTKFRDEARPRYGLIRGREFIMKDGYSFDISEEDAVKTYEVMKQTYHRIFQDLKLDYLMVEADVGAIGGKFSHEFVVKVPSGEAHIVYCENCGYAANVEAAKFHHHKLPVEDLKPLEKVHTPNVSSVEDVAKFLNLPVEKVVKTLIYKADDRFVAVLIRGDREVNETKLANVLKALDVRPASSEELKDLGIVEGFVGPIGLNLPLYADYSINELYNFVIGANEKDYHYINANIGRDFKVENFYDLATAKEKDPCPVCKNLLKETTGLEVGHIFLLGTKYSQAMKAYFTDKDGKEKPIVMGCYGIGVSRLIAAIVEQYHDDKGIIWPDVVAPFNLHILVLNVKDEKSLKAGFEIYEKAKKLGLDVLLDERDISPGAKFKDADLIGIPHRIVIGKALNEGKIEYQKREKLDEKQLIDLDSIEDLFKIWSN